MFGFDTQTVLVVLSCIIFIPVPLIYLDELLFNKKNPPTPAPATWITWAVVGVINAIFYGLNVKEGEEWLPIFSIYTNVMIIAVTFFVLRAYIKRRHREGLKFEFSLVDKISLGLSAVIVFVFLLLQAVPGMKETAAVLIQVPLLIGFIPTYVGLVTGRGQEPVLPFLLGVASYIPQIGAVYVSEDASAALYAWPILNGVIGNGLVALFSWKQEWFTALYMAGLARWRKWRAT